MVYNVLILPHTPHVDIVTVPNIVTSSCIHGKYQYWRSE